MRLRSLDPQPPSVYLVHPREAGADSLLTLDPAIALALLQSNVKAAGYELPIARHASTIEPRSFVR